MSIQFAAIVHEQDVLAKHPEHTHHPYELIISNLERLNRKVTLTHGEYHYHVVCEGAYLFLCVAHKDFSMKMCYALLGELKDITLRGEKNLKAELKNRMDFYNHDNEEEERRRSTREERIDSLTRQHDDDDDDHDYNNNGIEMNNTSRVRDSLEVEYTHGGYYNGVVRRGHFYMPSRPVNRRRRAWVLILALIFLLSLVIGLVVALIVTFCIEEGCSRTSTKKNI